MAEQAVVIARESVNQTSTVDKLKIDTFLRLAGKAYPVEYGEKQVVEHQGAQKLEIVVREEVKPVRAASVTAQLTEAGASVIAAVSQSLPALQGKSEVEDAVVEGVPEAEGCWDRSRSPCIACTTGSGGLPTIRRGSRS